MEFDKFMLLLYLLIINKIPKINNLCINSPGQDPLEHINNIETSYLDLRNVSISSIEAN